ncbi:MAG TPA: hypothetical protein VD838_18270, partial [Anaeromyxobacteraceae bacterium]|nr:hypothetical protein [Anaeromyxobacteraceae bacterium]
MTKLTAATPAGRIESAPTSTAPTWPADVPPQPDAEGILCAALGGLKAAEDAALESALAALTPIEKDALLGRPIPIDPEAIRRAASLRYRVTTAIRGAPSDGAEVDGGALSALLGEVDGALAAVAALAPSVPPDHASALEAIRNALVKEAIDLSEIAQRVA